MAALDGACDKHLFKFNNKTYKSIKSDEDFNKFCAEHPDFNNLLNSEERDDDGYYKGIWPFLKEYFNQSNIKVYRGFILTDKDINKNTDIRRVIFSPDKLIPFISNETKEFNSFTVDPKIAFRFANNFYNVKGGNQVIIEGLADRNDINWAFTAYLFGRHHGTAEHELNINNIRQLKNLHVVQKWSTIKLQSPIDRKNVQQTITNIFNKKCDYNTINKLIEYNYHSNYCTSKMLIDNMLHPMFSVELFKDNKQRCYIINHIGNIILEANKIDIMPAIADIKNNKYIDSSMHGIFMTVTDTHGHTNIWRYYDSKLIKLFNNTNMSIINTNIASFIDLNAQKAYIVNLDTDKKIEFNISDFSSPKACNISMLNNYNFKTELAVCNDGTICRIININTGKVDENIYQPNIKPVPVTRKLYIFSDIDGQTKHLINIVNGLNIKFPDIETPTEIIKINTNIFYVQDNNSGLHAIYRLTKDRYNIITLIKPCADIKSDTYNGKNVYLADDHNKYIYYDATDFTIIKTESKY